MVCATRSHGASVCPPGSRPRRSDARVDAIHRQMFQDHPGGEQQHLIRRNASAAATLAQLARALVRPSSPVAALAIPVFTTSAQWRCQRPDVRGTPCTGAAANRLCVNTPPTAVPSSNWASNRSPAVGLAHAACTAAKRTRQPGEQERDQARYRQQAWQWRDGSEKGPFSHAERALNYRCWTSAI